MFEKKAECLNQVYKDGKEITYLFQDKLRLFV